MDSIAKHRGLQRMSRTAGILPWLAVLALVFSELYIRFMFGRWPRVYRDSPQFPFSDTVALVAVFAAMSWPAMICVALLLPVVRLSQQARPVFNGWVVSAGVGAVLLYLLCSLDPYGFLEWAFD
ncbi:MAG TPA: hypothetical protein VER11_30275 [Polyangiaceae bacterium]|nr:hypothetical protein [Polyangiaceae bacterium]